MNNALIIFIKNSEHGKVKTRLAKTVGNDEALKIYKLLLQHTLSATKDVDADKYLYYSDYADLNDEWPNEVYNKQVQIGNDLGERMAQAFTNQFKNGHDYVCIIGSDCPGISTSLINDAFSKLQTSDVVIGPATDGGYYLLAMKQFYASLFSNINWSTEDVLPATLEVCKNLALSVTMLDALNDIDEEKDLVHFSEELNKAGLYKVND